MQILLSCTLSPISVPASGRGGAGHQELPPLCPHSPRGCGGSARRGEGSATMEGSRSALGGLTPFTRAACCICCWCGRKALPLPSEGVCAAGGMRWRRLRRWGWRAQPCSPGSPKRCHASTLSPHRVHFYQRFMHVGAVVCQLLPHAAPFLCAMSEPPVPWGATATVALPSVVATSPGWHLSPRQQPFRCSQRCLPCTCGLPELPAASRRWGCVVAASCRGTCAEPSCRPGPTRAQAPGVGRAAVPQHAGTVCGPGTGRGSGAHLAQASSASLTLFLCLSSPF